MRWLVSGIVAVSVVCAAFGSQRNLAPNGGLEDTLSAGRLRHWLIGNGTVTFEPGVKGQCVHYRPAANKPYWEIPLESERLPIEPGKRYLLSVRIKARNVHGLHVKFYFLRPETTGKPGRYDRAAGEYYQLLPSPVDWRSVRRAWDWSQFHAGFPKLARSGTWGWQQWQGVFGTTRKALTQGKVEVWVERKGGDLWLDEFRLTELGGATERPLPSLETQRQVVRIGRADLAVLTRGDRFLGIGRIRLDGFEARRGDMPWRVLVSDSERRAPGAPKLLSVVREGERLVLRLRFGEGPNAADMTWEFRPTTVRIGDFAWDGLQTRCTVRWPRRTFKLLEIGAWQPGGGILGARQRVDTLRPAVRFRAGAPHSVGFSGGQERKIHPGVVRYGDGVPSFDWIEREGAGTLLIFHDRPMLIRSAEMKPLDWNGLLTLNYYCFRPAVEATTPWEYVLMSKAKGFDEWARARDDLYAQWRAAFGLKRPEPLPAIQLRWAANWIRMSTPEEAVKRAAEMGFKRVLVYTPWVSDQGKNVGSKSGCAPWALQISPRLGQGTLQGICDTAHALGMRVFAWLGLGHLSNRSPLLKEHPEWAVHCADGAVYNWGYGDLTCVSALSGWAGYARGRLQAIRKETGLDGFWLDSYWNFGLEPIQYAGGPAPQFEAYLRLQRDLEHMGYECLVEAHSSPFGLPAHGFPFPLTELAGREHVGYKTSPFVTATAEHTRDLLKVDYFTLLANKCTPIIFFHPLLRQPGGSPFRESVMRANRAFNAVHEWMDIRTGDPGGRWVEWRDAETDRRVVFALKNCEFPLAAGTATEVTSGTVSLPRRGKVTLRGRRVYQILSPSTSAKP